MSTAGTASHVDSGSIAEALGMKFEAVVIPVVDVDRSKEFYAKLGWRLDADFRFDNGFRVVQFTPPGSGCSVQFGTKMTSAPPGSAQGLYLIVSDVAAARKDLVARGVEVSEAFYPGEPGAQFQIDGSGRISGPAPDHATYNSFATFRDPDGNGWLLQEITTRLPGRGLAVWTSRPSPTSCRRLRSITVNTSLPLRSTIGPAGTRPTLSRVRAARLPNWQLKKASST